MRTGGNVGSNAVDSAPSLTRSGYWTKKIGQQVVASKAALLANVQLCNTCSIMDDQNCNTQAGSPSARLGSRPGAVGCGRCSDFLPAVPSSLSRRASSCLGHAFSGASLAVFHPSDSCTSSCSRPRANNSSLFRQRSSLPGFRFAATASRRGVSNHRARGNGCKDGRPFRR